MTSYFPFIFYLVLNSSYNCYAYHSLPLIFRYLACLASASNRDIARKLERERKKMESGRRAENRKQRFLLSPPPPPPPSFLFFFALVPTFSTNLRGNACYAGYPLFCSSSAQNCLILPAECSPQKLLIQIEILPAEFIQATTHPSVTGQEIYNVLSVHAWSCVLI